MKNFNKLEQFADSIMTLCEALYDCEEIDVNIDVDINAEGISISVDLIPVEEDENKDDCEVSEEDLDKACAEHYDCCGCPYENYCNGEEDDDE